jgi:hypothetical protein
MVYNDTHGAFIQKCRNIPAGMRRNRRNEDMTEKAGKTVPPVLLFLFLTISAHAQDRGRMSVYVPMPTGGMQSQRSYFQENFKMELIGANYPVAEDRSSSMYTLLLDIQDNPGFDSRLPIDDENNRYDLGIKLERSGDDYEIVSFSFPFSDTESMSGWNLFLLYQALANAYTPEAAGQALAIDDRWRGKRLYLSVGAGVDSTHFLESGGNRIFWGLVMPVAMLGLEFQFIDVFSLGLGLVNLRELNDGERWIFSLSAPLLLKWVIKPDYERFSNAMMEIYGGTEFCVNFGGEAPWLSALAGVELGIKGGSRYAWTLDVGAAYGLLGEASLSDGVRYDLLRFTLAIGWKVGFFTR